MKIIRVFPRKTNATPTDADVRVNCCPSLFDDADEIHISVTFTWDLHKAEKLARAWRFVAPVKIGGPAIGERGGQFTPGLYLKRGYVITSRGCPNNCWFCSVPKREGNIRELVITDGYNILDDNLLACADEHIRAVLNMLSRQKEHPIFSGGLEAKRMQFWIACALRQLHPQALFFAYDTPDDLEPLKEAWNMLRDAGFPTKGHRLRAYVLCGWRMDTIDAATERMRETLNIGFTPMAMALRDNDGKISDNWRRFQRLWARPAIIHSADKWECADQWR